MAVEYYAIKVCDECDEEVERIDLRYRGSHLDFPEEEGWQLPSEEALCNSCESDKEQEAETRIALEKRYGEKGQVLTAHTYDCKYCDAQYEIERDDRDYALWKADELGIKEAFPYLSASEREMILSGTCDECWDKFFPQ